MYRHVVELEGVSGAQKSSPASQMLVLPVQRDGGM